MTAAKAGATVSSDGVDFIDENDAGSVLFPLNEKIAHARRSDADEHFDEVRAANAKKGHAGFTGNRPG